MAETSLQGLPAILAAPGSAALAFGALPPSSERRLSARSTREEKRLLVGLGQHHAGL